MSIRYPKEVHDFIKENVSGNSATVLVIMINEKFGMDFTPGKMKAYKNNHKLKSGTPGGMPKGSPSEEFPLEAGEFIRKNYDGIGPKQMTEMINHELGKQYTHQQIKTFYKNHELNSGLNGRFQKGSEPPNKGKKMSVEQYEKCKATMFKNGDVPQNHMKVGECTHTTDGYLVRKVKENGTQRERFEFVHRAVWEKYNGPIPDGKLISFLDGDKDNCGIKNLALIDNEENLEMNRSRLRFSNAECTRSGVLVAKLRVQTRKKRRKK